MEKAESLEDRMGNCDIGNAFLVKIRTISESFEDPEGIEQAMRHMMEKTRAKIHAIYVKDVTNVIRQGNGYTRSVQPNEETVQQKKWKHRKEARNSNENSDEG